MLYAEVQSLIETAFTQYVDKSWIPHLAAKELNFQVGVLAVVYFGGGGNGAAVDGCVHGCDL